MTDRDIDREDVEDWTHRDAAFYESKGNKPPMIARDATYYTGEKQLSDEAEQAKQEFRGVFSEDDLDNCPDPVQCPFTDSNEPHSRNDHPQEADTRHPSSQRFHQILRSLGDLHDQKQRDYGTSEDPFANVRASEAFGLPPWLGAIIRGNDKMRRIMTASNQVMSGEKISMANESFEDALQDLAVYAIIALVLYEEEQAW